MKQVILVRNDLKMPKGKMAAQVSHASVESVLKSDKKLVQEWYHEGMKKVILKVDSMKELLKFKNDAEDSGMVTAMITDAGRTFFKQPETTCLAIGPDDEDKIDSLTGKLKLVE